MIYFVDKNKKLVEAVKKAVGGCGFIKCEVGDVFKKPRSIMQRLQLQVIQTLTWLEG